VHGKGRGGPAPGDGDLPVRGDRRETRLPLPRRAPHEGHLRHHRRRARRVHGAFEHAGAEPDPGTRGFRDGRLRALPPDVHLPPAPVGGALGPDRDPFGGGRNRGPHPRRAGGGGPVRPRRGGPAPSLVQRLLRDSLSSPQARSDRDSRLRRRRHGELGGHDLPGDGLACASLRGLRPEPPAGGHRRGPRDGPPVVRGPRHHGLVGRPLAQRGIRVLDGGQGGGRPLPGVGDVGALPERGQERGPGDGRPGLHPSHRGRRGGSGGDQRDLRRHQLHQGGLPPPDARVGPGAGDLPALPVRLLQEVRLRQRPDRRPLAVPRRPLLREGGRRGEGAFGLDEDPGLPLAPGVLRGGRDPHRPAALSHPPGGPPGPGVRTRPFPSGPS